MALPSPLPSCARGCPSRSRVESGTPGTGVLVPASIRGELACSRKSSVVLLETSQFARILKAAEALGVGEVAADVVGGGGEPQVVPQIGVADDGGGLTAAQAGGDAGRGDGVADDQGVGDPHLGVVDLGDEGVVAHAAAVAGEGVAARLGGLGQGVADDGVVSDLGGGLVDVEAAAEHEGGVAVHQVVGEVRVAVNQDAAAAQGGAVVLDDVAGHECSRGTIEPDAATLAEQGTLGDVLEDGVRLDAGVRGDGADAGPLDVDAAAEAPGAGGDLFDDVPADDVADDDWVAVADVDAAADPVGLRARHDVAGDDVVADHGVAQHEHAAAGDPRHGIPVLADAALDGAALDGEVGARAAAGAGGGGDRRASPAGGVEDGGGGTVADDVHVGDDVDPLGVVAGRDAHGGARDGAGDDLVVGVVDGGLDGAVGGGLAAAAGGAGAVVVDVQGDGPGRDHQPRHHPQGAQCGRAREKAAGPRAGVSAH